MKPAKGTQKSSVKRLSTKKSSVELQLSIVPKLGKRIATFVVPKLVNCNTISAKVAKAVVITHKNTTKVV